MVIMYFTITIPFLVLLFFHLSTLGVELVLVFNFSALISLSIVTVLLCIIRYMTNPRKVYLVDFACYKPEPELMTSNERLIEAYRDTGRFNDKNLAFMNKILNRSGFGHQTYVAEAVFKRRKSPAGIADAREEADMVMFGAIDQVLEKSGVRVSDVGIVVVNCSIFCPTPSLSATIVNHYKLRDTVLTYNLSGMGCSAGIISIDLANQLLQVHPKSYALVVSLESLSLNRYFGNNESMLMANCLFKVGGAAILLSNRSSDLRRSKYQLMNTVRTHRGADDKSYNCIYQKEDDEKIVGVSLSKEIVTVAGEALKSNLTTLGPLVLPIREQLGFIASIFAQKVLGMKRAKPYVPDFKRAFEHFCIHAGGKAVLDGIQKNLSLSEWQMEPSRMALYRFGNTSSSSLWYELAYSEAKGRIQKGDKVLQLAFGSGFKCNSAVWRALKTIDPDEVKNPWTDEIHEFPVQT